MQSLTSYAYSYTKNVCYDKRVYLSDSFDSIGEAEDEARLARVEDGYKILSIFAIDVVGGAISVVRYGQEFNDEIDAAIMQRRIDNGMCVQE